MATNSNIKGIESGRAKQAFDYVNNVVEFKDTKYFKEFLEKKFINEKDDPQAKKVKEDCINNFLNNKECNDKDFYKKIGEAKEKFLKEYKSYVKKVPMYILNNGLAATFAFAMSKGKNQPSAWNIIYKQTEDWLKKQGNIDQGDLMKELLSLDSYKYRIATKETLALFNWLRRFAEGLIEGEENE